MQGWAVSSARGRETLRSTQAVGHGSIVVRRLLKQQRTIRNEHAPCCHPLPSSSMQFVPPQSPRPNLRYHCLACLSCPLHRLIAARFLCVSKPPYYVYFPAPTANLLVLLVMWGYSVDPLSHSISVECSCCTRRFPQNGKLLEGPYASFSDIGTD